MKLHALVIAGLLLTIALASGCDEMIADMLKGDVELDKAARSGDPQACMDLDAQGGSRANECIGEMARYQKDPAVCELLMAGYYRDACIEKAAIAKGDAKLCDDTGTRREGCLKGVAVRLKDRSYCQEITAGDVQNACFKDVALAAGNPQYCRDIADAYTKRTCLNEYAVEHTEAEYCDETEGLRDSCVTQIAMRKDSTKDCLKLTAGLYNCVFSVAEHDEDAAVCLAITSAGTRDKCIHNLAVTKHDTAVCESLKDAALKSSCIKSTTLDKLQS